MVRVHWILSLVLVLLTGCGTPQLKEDPVIPAIKANYPTLEFWACSKLWHGLGVCYIEPDQPHTSVNLRVQGYYKGTGRIYSQTCEIDKTFTYTENQLIPIEIPELEPGRNCLVNVILSPEYPKEWRSGIAIWSLKGMLAIRVRHGDEDWSGHVRRLTGRWKSQLDLQVGPHKAARVAIRGCGVKYDKKLGVDNGWLRIELSEAYRREVGDCVAEGVALISGVRDTTFSVLTAQYATELPLDPDWRDFGFIPLAIPVWTLNGSTLKVTAQEAVSIISLNDKYEIDNEAKFSFDRKRTNILRLITVKGRTVLGVWYPGSQDWEWYQ